MNGWLADQCQAAGDDHAYNERLEVVVLNEDVSVATHLPEDAANKGVVEHVEQRRTLGRATLWTAFIRVFDKHHVHLTINTRTSRMRNQPYTTQA